MYQFQIRVLAKEDIQHIVDYYEEHATYITDRFLDNLYAEFELIKQAPKQFQIKYKNTRVRYVKGFPYGVHYNLNGQRIEVLAVLHTSRNPKIWEKR